MKEGWKMVKLGEVCETSAGGTPSKLHKEYYENGNIPWMLSGEVCHKYIYDVEHYITLEGLNNSSAKLFPENTVVVAMYGATAGQVGILKLVTSTNQAVCGILPNDNILPEYLYYYFLYYKDLLVAQAVGNAQPNISQQKIKSVEFPFLSIEEQHRIVSILDASFEKIDALKKNAEENLKNAKALFQQVLAQELKPKEGWVEKKFENIVVKNEVGLVKNSKEQSIEYKYPYLKMGNITSSNNLDMSSIVNVNATEDEVNRYSLVYGDFLFNTRNSKELVGKSCVYNRNDEICLYNNNIIRFNFINEINPFFINYLFSNTNVKEQLEKIKKGTTNVWAIYYKELRDIIINIPSLETQHRIVRTLDTLCEKCRRLEQVAQQTIHECDALKQSILRQAFSGEL